MPVHLIWGMTRDQDPVYPCVPGVSIYTPEIETEQNLPDVGSDELKPAIITVEEE